MVFDEEEEDERNIYNDIYKCYYSFKYEMYKREKHNKRYYAMYFVCFLYMFRAYITYTAVIISLYIIAYHYQPTAS
jgi:Trk-type K+ transport system membrane component